jgi:hypothetical protein
MLREIGIVSKKTVKNKKISFQAEPRCCGNIIHDSGEACLVCDKCGKVLEQRMVRCWPYYKYDASISGCFDEYSNGVKRFIPMDVKKKRYYECRQNFRSYLNKYAGVSAHVSLAHNRHVLRLRASGWNPKCKNAYIAAYKFLKGLKAKEAAKLYKHIWSIIYENGGDPPSFDADKVIQEIKNFQNFYYDVLAKDFRNVTGTWFILGKILEICGHVSFYSFPELINKDKQDKVEAVWAKFIDARNSRNQMGKSRPQQLLLSQ